jgi:hypothetical protein
MNGDKVAGQDVADFDDTEIKCLLLGDERDRQKAANGMMQFFGHRLMGKLRDFYWLSDDEKATVIHDTVIEVLKKAEQSDLDVERPLVGLLLRMCKCRAIDLSRRKCRNTSKDDELTEKIARTLVDTKVGLAWRDAVSNEDASIIRREFLAFVQTLPDQQKLVAGILAEQLGFDMSHEALAQKIYHASGKVVSKIAIKGALSQIRQKFKALLKQKHPELPI